MTSKNKIYVTGHYHEFQEYLPSNYSYGEWPEASRLHINQQLREVRHVARVSRSGHRVGVEFTRKELKKGRPFLRRIANAIDPDFLEHPTVAELEYLMKCFPQKTISQDELLAAVVLRQKGRLVALDSHTTDQPYYQLEEILEILKDVQPSPANRRSTAASDRVKLVAVTSKLKDFPKLKACLIKLCQEWPSSKMDLVSFRKKALRVRADVKTTFQQVSVPLRDKFMAKRAIRSGCRLVCLGSAHVPGTATLFKFADLQPVVLTSQPNDKLGLTGVEWLKYFQREQSRRGRTRQRQRAILRKEMKAASKHRVFR